MPPQSLKRKIVRLGVILAVPIGLLGGCLSIDLIMLSKVRPPKTLKTIQDFQAWKGGAILGQGTYENSGTTYTVMLAPAGRTLASVPSAYLFDQDGQFVDWTSDRGDFYTVKNRFDLTSGHVKNIERKRR
jgi:hypothetical protein